MCLLCIRTRLFCICSGLFGICTGLFSVPARAHAHETQTPLQKLNPKTRAFSRSPSRTTPVVLFGLERVVLFDMEMVSRWVFSMYLASLFSGILPWNSRRTWKEANSLQHTASCCTPCSIATHSNSLQHIATQCNTLHHTAQLRRVVNGPDENTLQHSATHCNALQRTATHCNALQRTATQLLHSTNSSNSEYTRISFA